MRHSFLPTTIFIIVTLLCLSGCRNVTYWKKSTPKPQRNAIITNDSDVAAFNDFRTIDASMIDPPSKTKKNKSLLWESSQASDINSRLGVKD